MVTSPSCSQGMNRVGTFSQTTAARERFPGIALDLPPTPLFGTDGIRGKVGDILSPSLAMQAGYWAGQVWRESMATLGPIIIGQDSRNSSDMLALATAAGLTAAGLEVWYLGLCPTPCVAYLTKITEAVGGVMISASHNPPEDNGIKFFSSNGTKLAATCTDKIEAGIRGILGSKPDWETPSWGRQCYRPTSIGAYEQSLLESLPAENHCRGLRIVLDLAWGAAVQIAPSVFRALGAEVVCLHERPDGDRINVNCGSTHLDRLKTAVLQHKADLGFAFDGDADRVMAVDDRGRAVNGDYILYLWGQSLKLANRLPDNLIVATVMANLGFERAWQQLGGQLLRTPVGDQHVQAQMWQTGAVLGGEQSGHVLCHHYGVSGDGIQTALHLATIVHQSGTTLAELVNNSFKSYPQILQNVRVDDRERRTRWQECEPLQQEILRAQAAMASEGRVLVRASGTEPVIRVMVEAADIQVTNYWGQRLATTVWQHLVN